MERWAVVLYVEEERGPRCGSFFFCFFLDVGVNMMRCSSFSGSESLDRDLRAQIICVIPPSLSFHISRDMHHAMLCDVSSSDC